MLFCYLQNHYPLGKGINTTLTLNKHLIIIFWRENLIFYALPITLENFHPNILFFTFPQVFLVTNF